MHRAIRWMLAVGWIGGFVLLAQGQGLDPASQLARDIFQQLIESGLVRKVFSVTNAKEQHG